MSSAELETTSDSLSKASMEDNRVFPGASSAGGEINASNKEADDEFHMRQISSDHDEGVEVVLEGSGKDRVVDPLPRSGQDQNVFRAPHPVRPRAVRGGHPPHVHASGSYGYGHPPPHPYSSSHPPSHGDYRQAGSYHVPYAYSGSFDQDGSYPGPPPTSHHSPHVQYPPHGARRPEDVNVISPNHKDHPHHAPPHHPPVTPRSNGSSSGRYPPHSGYHYPPASPVSRPGGPSSSSPPRSRGYGMRRPEGPYAAAQRGRDDPAYPTPDRSRPPLVAESSFDSEYYSSHTSSHPTTPNAPHYGPPHGDSHYGYGTSFEGSFDGHTPHGPPSHHSGYYDDRSPYYGHSPSHPHSESPYSTYSYGYSPGSSYYDPYSPHASHYGRHPRSYDEHERYHHHHHYHHPDYEHGMKKDEKSGMILPKAASEVDFDITDPPMEPTTPASTTPVCESPADVNSYDVLCGRGGGTNSQVGNRRFRKLVQEFQPIYLLARRKEKPLLARTIVLIIRKRGGRFLKKDEETGELYEVGDAKAEAKTSQALREGLDVRATKSAASSLMDKKKKKSKSAESSSVEDGAISPTGDKHSEDDDVASQPDSPAGSSSNRKNNPKDRAESPPTLPKLHDEVVPTKSSSPTDAPPSPEQMQFRKRRRMRSADGDVTTAGCGVNPFSGDKLFPDFCPPRADLGRTASPPPRGEGDPMDVGMTPIPPHKYDDDDICYEQDTPVAASAGCAGIALDMMTGAAAGSFCLGPRQWR